MAAAHFHNAGEWCPVGCFTRPADGILQPYTTEEKSGILKGLIEGSGFEQFLYVKYGGEKRFGVEGCEVLIPGLCRRLEHILIIDRSVSGMQRMVIRAGHLHKVNNVVFGMPHRFDRH